MDFTFSEDTTDLRDLARTIATTIVTPQRLSDLSGRFDAELWKQLADAGLLGALIPSEGDGPGLGLGVVDALVVAEELGRVLATVPYGWSSIAAAGMLAHDAPTHPLLAQIADGSAIVAVALEEDHRDRRRPTSSLTGDTISGDKVNVAYAQDATAFLVSVDDGGRTRVALVDATAANLTITPVAVTGQVPTATLQFDGTPIVETFNGTTLLDELATLAVCADQCGATQRALELTAEYGREREQFGRPIGSFQAVAQRLADGYIDCRALSLTTTQAAWFTDQQLSGGEVDAGECATAIDVAKYWAAHTGHRVGHTAVHVHGGVGLDTDHGIHRYFLRAKQNEFTLGATPDRLTHLGALLAESAGTADEQ